MGLRPAPGAAPLAVVGGLHIAGNVEGTLPVTAPRLAPRGRGAVVLQRGRDEAIRPGRSYQVPLKPRTLQMQQRSLRCDGYLRAGSRASRRSGPLVAPGSRGRGVFAR